MDLAMPYPGLPSAPSFAEAARSIREIKDCCLKSLAPKKVAAYRSNGHRKANTGWLLVFVI